MNRRSFFRWALRAGAVAAVGLKVIGSSLAQVDDNLYGPSGEPYPGPSPYKPSPPRLPEAYPGPAAQEPVTAIGGHDHSGGSEAVSAPKPAHGEEKPPSATRAPRK